jgi:hypothetical protein
MDLYYTASIIASVLGSAFYIHRELKADHKDFREELRAQGTRIDQLYTMFVDLLKERNAR